ncbi:MAG: ComF family protein [Clostridia bacterium]|nr:ComF family protein [Clostridia bacterium]
MFFPPVCGFCGKLDRNSLCNKCKIQIQKNNLSKIEDYKNTSSYFDEHIYLFQYSGEIRNMILNYKFREKSYIYSTFVELIKNNKKICAQIKKYDIIMPVPISKKRLNTRGYNQSALIAGKIAKTLNMCYEENILVKIKDNKPQSEMGQEKRKSNVKDVYTIKNKEKIYQKKILLIDDIFTTGNTVNECAKVLIENFASSVGIFTIAKD